MRLIDADVVEDTLKKCVSNAYKRRDVQCATGVSLAILQLKNIPTAYDIDKVVEELESNSFITVKNEEVQTKRKDIQSYIAVEKEVVLLEDAIKIVKQGGVVDDVCEWECKYINDKYSYLTSCGNIFIYETNSVYCPYCGKKIKMVE